MTLQKLGIERHYDSASIDRISYTIRIDSNRLKGPKQSKRYFKEILDVVGQDVRKNNDFKNCTISIDERYLEQLRNSCKSTLEYYKDAQQQFRDLDEKTPDITGFLAKTGGVVGAICGGLVGLILGYNVSSEFATNIANHMNEASYLWAPITGLVQLIIPVVGTAGITAIATGGGAVILGAGGGITGKLLSSPYSCLKSYVSRKASQYESLDSILSEAKPINNK